MNKIYLFDVDGTLTPSRQHMEPSFKEFFSEWLENKMVYLVTGSDINKLREQIDSDILSLVDGTFTSMGNEFYIDDELIYSKNDKIPTECILFLHEELLRSKYPYSKGSNHFEYRVGMLNFSTIGRDISLEDRNKYNDWDIVNNERKDICNKFNERFKFLEYEAKIGGQISIDIQKIGKDKSQVVDYLYNIYKGSEFIFFGDKTEYGGNDFDLANKIIEESLGSVYQVSGPNDCLNKLKRS